MGFWIPGGGGYLESQDTKQDVCMVAWEGQRHAQEIHTNLPIMARYFMWQDGLVLVVVRPYHQQRHDDITGAWQGEDVKYSSLLLRSFKAFSFPRGDHYWFQARGTP